MEGPSNNHSMATSAAAFPETSDDDEYYEAVVYTGPNVPPGDTSSKEGIGKAGHPSMNVRLAQRATEYEGLLSPDFCLSSSDSSRGTPSSSESVHPLSSGRNHQTPFNFPNVDTTTITNEEEKLERIQVLDETPPPEENESEWEEWPQNFISGNGYELGIQARASGKTAWKPGSFYKRKSDLCYYVKLPHRSRYKVVLTNGNPTYCHLDLEVNKKETNKELIPPESTRTIDGPQYSNHAFILYRANEAPTGINVNVDDSANGHIMAVFTPCRAPGVDSRERSTSEPPRSDPSPEEDIFEILNNPDAFITERSMAVSPAGAEEGVRSLNLSEVSTGVTCLVGEQEQRRFIPAPPMETDPDKKVTLQLRLIVSLDEEEDATGEEIYSVEPPLPKTVKKAC